MPLRWLAARIAPSLSDRVVQVQAEVERLCIDADAEGASMEAAAAQQQLAVALEHAKTELYTQQRVLQEQDRLLSLFLFAEDMYSHRNANSGEASRPDRTPEASLDHVDMWDSSPMASPPVAVDPRTTFHMVVSPETRAILASVGAQVLSP